MSRLPIDAILDLPTAERVAVVQAIWESIISEPQNVPLTAAQKEELERRWEDLEANPDEGEPWQDVKNALLSE